MTWPENVNFAPDQNESGSNSLFAHGQQTSPFGPVNVRNKDIMGGAQIDVQNNSSDVGNTHTLNLVNGLGTKIVTSITGTITTVEIDNTTDFVTLTNQQGSVITQGQVVAITTGGVQLANATDGTKRGFAICTATVNSGLNGTFQTQGILTLSDWTAGLVSGSTLTLGSRYYLSTIDGKLTTTAPSSSGNLVQPVGYAITATTLKVVFETPMFVR